MPNRILLAPLAGIGNWFVRLQAKRYGAGLAVSEMVSSHAIAYRNRRTLNELLRVAEAEREGGPVAVQLFGADPKVMAVAAREVSRRGVDLIDLNMGCPVPKVCKSGAGAALLEDPRRAVALVQAAREGSQLPVTVKLRSGRRAGDTSGLELAQQLVEEGGASAIGIHPRPASAKHKGEPAYGLAADLARRLAVPVILSGGLREAARIGELFNRTGVAAVMIARGSLGNPWLFSVLAGRRAGGPAPEEVVAELSWLAARAAEHLGLARAVRYLRKFYPWYAERLPLRRAEIKALTAQAQQLPTIEAVLEAFRTAALKASQPSLVVG